MSHAKLCRCHPVLPRCCTNCSLLAHVSVRVSCVAPHAQLFEWSSVLQTCHACLILRTETHEGASFWPKQHCYMCLLKGPVDLWLDNFSSRLADHLSCRRLMLMSCCLQVQARRCHTGQHTTTWLLKGLLDMNFDWTCSPVDSTLACPADKRCLLLLAYRCKLARANRTQCACKVSISKLRMWCSTVMFVLCCLQMQAKGCHMVQRTTRPGCPEASPTSPMWTSCSIRSLRMTLPTTLKHAVGCTTRLCTSSGAGWQRLTKSSIPRSKLSQLWRNELMGLASMNGMSLSCRSVVCHRDLYANHDCVYVDVINACSVLATIDGAYGMQCAEQSRS